MSRRADIVAFVNRLAERHGMSMVFRTARKELVKDERKMVAKLVRIKRSYRTFIVTMDNDERECILKEGRYYHVLNSSWSIGRHDRRIKKVRVS